MQDDEHSQSIYLDTVILIGFFEKSDIGKHSRNVIKQVERMLKNPKIIVKIPLIVLGEFLVEMLNREEDLSKLFRRINPKFEGTSRESYELALKLMQQDKYLEANDALMVAQAILDKKSEWLITTDTILIGNQVILKEIDSRKSKLKISESFEKH